ncbi:hypothetical protein M0765_026610 [Variovorax sp. S2]|uniref:hypothetical protein n=1 Tax=Variovorax sp. S12S4 TaxID=3029170 RepID=UPI00215BF160|nr:hypothetical protein [Variovorax sp. S12S4]MCR8961172.1 hypothetical protein [Variovorax sp. S12S4]
MSLFELRVTALVPALGNGRTLKTNAIAEDGFDYAVKAITDDPMLPCSEWLSYQLAQSVALSCPACAILIMPDGTRAFGSRIQPGLTRMEEAIQSGVRPEDFLADCADRLSVAYALDVFIANIDRHFGNFLFGTNSLNKRTAMPIDYSHALLVGGWPLRDIIGKHNATTLHMAILRLMNLWRSPQALMALGTLSQVKKDQVGQWLLGMPPSWLHPEKIEAIVTWWGGEDFHARVSKCVQYCQP